MNILTAENVNRKIRGAEILKDVNLSLESGNIYAFVGKNGSGKTMLFRALSGLMNINSGVISYNKQILNKDISVLPSLGITIEHSGLYPEYTGLKNLKMLAKLKNIIGDDEIRKAIERVGLDPDDKRTFRKYSLGMKQRIIIAQAIMESPEVIMLDEPTSGLDDDGTELIRRLISEEKERGALILIATHIREDVSLLADKVFRVDCGNVREEDAN